MNLFGTMGKERVLTPGRELTLFEEGGSGTLTHMWFGGSWPGWGNTRIRVYVDGEQQAGIDMGLFMGHGIGWNDDDAPWGTNRIGKTGHPSGVYNTYKIPFGNRVKVTAELASEVHQPQTFWWIVRGVTNYAAYVGHIALPASARLRLHRKENFRAKPLQEVEILNTERNGLLYAVTLAAASGNFNYLEACMPRVSKRSQRPDLVVLGHRGLFPRHLLLQRRHVPSAGGWFDARRSRSPQFHVSLLSLPFPRRRPDSVSARLSACLAERRGAKRPSLRRPEADNVDFLHMGL